MKENYLRGTSRRRTKRIVDFMVEDRCHWRKEFRPWREALVISVEAAARGLLAQEGEDV